MVKKILEIPKTKQFIAHCGVASLLMVLGYYGIDIKQRELANYFGGSEEILKNGGTPRQEIVDVAKQFGLTSRRVSCLKFQDIIDYIDNEIPIISRARVPICPRGRHYRVIKGYREHKGLREVYVNDPYFLRINKFDWTSFNKLWLIRGKDGTKNYGIIITKK